jgi:hypothetical protein
MLFGDEEHIVPHLGGPLDSHELLLLPRLEQGIEQRVRQPQIHAHFAAGGRTALQQELEHQPLHIFFSQSRVAQRVRYAWAKRFVG